MKMTPEISANKSLPERFYETILGILTAENDALASLEENLKRQYDVLMNNQLNEFLQVLEEQHALIWEIDQKEELRRQEIQQFLPNAKELSLNQIIADAPQAYREKLTQLKSSFNTRIENIQKMKTQNQMLMQKSLELVEKQLQIVRGLNRTGYKADGQVEDNNLSLLNRQI